MSNTQIGKGSCLCGAIKFTALEMNRNLGACHCEMCRKWTGGPLMSVNCGTKIKIDGEKYLGIYDSSDWAERGFCKKCGSGLFYRIKGKLLYHIPMGLFDEFDEIQFDNQVFIDKKPSYYRFSDQTKDLTEAEIFAMFGPSQD